MPHTYICPAIPQNLRKEESYVQIAEALNYLSDVSEDIFQRVNNRIKYNRDKLRSVKLRMQAAQEKIQCISAAKHAVQIFSSSKYPASGIEEHPYQSLFSADSTLPIKRFEYQYKPVAPAQDEPLERLEFYHEPAHGDTVVRLDGLGNLPGDALYVGDLLFYNSGKNAYKQSTTIGDPLERAGKTHGQPPQSEPTELNLGDAPQSIADKNADPLSQMRTDSYFYFPDIGNVPTLDVPLDLPDLPGIADDVHYITSKELSIAPSLQHGLAKLPRNTAEKPPTTQPLHRTEEVEKITVETPESPTVLVVEPLSQDTPELPESLPDISEDVGDVSETTIGALPKPVFAPVDDPHSTLMEAIRKAAGGRNLRSAQVVESSIGNSSAGDLMTDLHAKLLMRRKGISGSKAGGSGESQTVMDKISGMIPAPSAIGSSGNEPLSESLTTEDEDWED